MGYPATSYSVRKRSPEVWNSLINPFNPKPPPYASLPIMSLSEILFQGCETKPPTRKIETWINQAIQSSRFPIVAIEGVEVSYIYQPRVVKIAASVPNNDATSLYSRFSIELNPNSVEDFLYKTLPSELGQSLPSELGQSLPSELGQSLPSELGQSLPSELGQSPPSDLGQSLPSELGQSPPSELGQSPADIYVHLQVPESEICYSPTDTALKKGTVTDYDPLAFQNYNQPRPSENDWRSILVLWLISRLRESPQRKYIVLLTRKNADPRSTIFQGAELSIYIRFMNSDRLTSADESARSADVTPWQPVQRQQLSMLPTANLGLVGEFMLGLGTRSVRLTVDSETKQDSLVNEVSRVCTDLGVYLTRLDHGKFFSERAGGTELYLRQLYFEASKNQPAIVLIEDGQFLNSAKSGDGDIIELIVRQGRAMLEWLFRNFEDAHIGTLWVEKIICSP